MSGRWFVHVPPPKLRRGPGAAWLCGILVGGWLATAAPVGPLLSMAGLFVAIFCAVRLDQPHSRREGYRRGYADGAHAAATSTVGQEQYGPGKGPLQH